MAVPGRTVLEQIQRALEQSRLDAAAAGTAQKTLRTQIDQVVSERGAAWLELAKHDLPDLRRETIQNTFSEIQRDLLLIVERKERTVADLTSRMERLVAVEQEQSRSRGTMESALAQAIQTQKQLEVQVQAELQQDPEFPALSQKAVEAEAALHRDERRVAEVQSESSEKLPSYERSSLFQYLYRRGYLTPEYSSRGLTRRLDRWVASLIEYPTAKRGYEFLTKTPQLMLEELTRRRELFHGLMSQVEAIQKQVADRLGLTQAIENVTSIRRQRDQLDQKIAESRQLSAKVEAELAAMNQDQCQFYQAALDRYRQFLESTRTEVLEQHASQTPGTRDDEIVSRIRGLTDSIDRLQSDLPGVTQRVTLAMGLADGLDFIKRRMQQSNFDDANSRFDGLDVPLLLERYQRGVLSKDALWTELKQRQKFDQPTGVGTGVDVANIITHPMTRVLAQAMVEVVGAALQNGVNKSIQRRSGGDSGWSMPSFPTSSGSGSGSRGDYTTVDRI